MFPTLSYRVQKLTWDAMERMCRVRDPTAVFAHAESQFEPEVHYVAEIGGGIMLSYRVLHEYKQIEFLTVFEIK